MQFKYAFEFFQKVLMGLDGNRRSLKVQAQNKDASLRSQVKVLDCFDLLDIFIVIFYFDFV